MCDYCYQNMEDNLYTCICLLDIEKCFDTINHVILLEKMKCYGIQNKEIEWFSNYLQNRRQIVNFKNKLSKPELMKIGIPQGSVLGPLLFLLFINDIGQSTYPCSCNMFADDVVIYCDAANVTQLESNMNKSLKNVNEWYKNNHLNVNASKCNRMVTETALS